MYFLPPIPDEWIDLGKGHKVKFVFEPDGSVGGLLEEHTSPTTGQPCGGIVPFGRDEWVLLCVNPIHIRPSINCHYCSSHGNVTKGQWQGTENIGDYLQAGEEVPEAHLHRLASLEAHYQESGEELPKGLQEELNKAREYVSKTQPEQAVPDQAMPVMWD